MLNLNPRPININDDHDDSSKQRVAGVALGRLMTILLVLMVMGAAVVSVVTIENCDVVGDGGNIRRSAA